MFRLAAGSAIIGVLAFAAPAMAWDEQECADWYAKYGTVHEDCQAPPKEETPPPVVTPPPTEVTPPPPPVAETPAPPAAPPAPPAPPPTAVPETPQETPAAPKVQTKKKPPSLEQTQGKTEQRPDRRERLGIPSPTPEIQTVSDTGSLPYTGVPVGLLLVGGASMAAAGFGLRRRASRQ